MLFYNYVYFLTNHILEIASSFLAKGQWFIGKIEMVLSSQHIVFWFTFLCETPCYPKAFQSKYICSRRGILLKTHSAVAWTWVWLRTSLIWLYIIHKWPQFGMTNFHYAVLNNIHTHSHRQTPNLFCSGLKDCSWSWIHAGSLTAERFTTNALLCLQAAGG